MRNLLTILLISLASLTFAQKVFTVDNFSKDYYCQIQIIDTPEVFSKRWVSVYDQRTNKKILKVVSDELALTLHDGRAMASIKSLPYGEQRLIMYKGFNFDGKKNFAICDGQHSCYHGGFEYDNMQAGRICLQNEPDTRKCLHFEF